MPPTPIFVVISHGTGNKDHAKYEKAGPCCAGIDADFGPVEKERLGVPQPLVWHSSSLAQEKEPLGLVWQPQEPVWHISKGLSVWREHPAVSGQ